MTNHVRAAAVAWRSGRRWWKLLSFGETPQSGLHCLLLSSWQWKGSCTLVDPSRTSSAQNSKLKVIIYECIFTRDGQPRA